MRRLVFFLLVLLSMTIYGLPAQARLGEKIKLFSQRHRADLHLKEVTIKQETKYYEYSVLIDPGLLSVAPGFACGLTATVKHGVIVGESMIVRFGEQPLKANDLAISYGLSFVNDALDRKPSALSEDNERKVFQKAIFQAMTTLPQELRFVGCKGKVVFSRSADNNLLIAAIPETI
ncbi:MAG: hypothetical protein KC777_17130 [Cyanobacteria bacterium HKST-UBA02]|nr:hypothetical protein [Cyanobacteria bacterium HKST-UBA02]